MNQRRDDVASEEIKQHNFSGVVHSDRSSSEPAQNANDQKFLCKEEKKEQKKEVT